MAIMLFLTVLAAALGLATAASRAALDRQLAGRMTVQVVDGNPAARDRTAARLLAALRASPAVARAAPVDPAALAKLLGPWLGDDAADAGLPIPTLIDVDLVSDTTSAQVTALVRAAGPTARVDPQAAWMSPVGGFMRSLVWLAALLVALMAAATAAVSHLNPFFYIISGFRYGFLGASDGYVAPWVGGVIILALDAALGGTAGTLAAAAVVMLVGGQLGALGSELVGAARLSAGDWIVLALLPLAFVLLAIAAARHAVVGTLRHQL